MSPYTESYDLRLVIIFALVVLLLYAVFDFLHTDFMFV